jgi:transposase
MNTQNQDTSSGRLRRQFSPEQKVQILRQQLLEKKPISEVCAEHSITPTMFYQWQKQFFENGAAAFGEKKHGPVSLKRDAAKVAALEAKLEQKNVTIGEIMTELIAVKKSLGEI